MRTWPCGTPLSALLDSETLPFTATRKFRSRRNALIHLIKPASIPYTTSLFRIKRWASESNAFEKSRNIMSATSPSSIMRVNHFAVNRRLVRQDLVGTKPCCAVESLAVRCRCSISELFKIASIILQTIDVKVTGR